MGAPSCIMVTVANRVESFNLVNKRNTPPPQAAKGVTGPLSLVSIRTQHCIRRGLVHSGLTPPPTRATRQPTHPARSLIAPPPPSTSFTRIATLGEYTQPSPPPPGSLLPFTKNLSTPLRGTPCSKTEVA